VYNLLILFSQQQQNYAQSHLGFGNNL